MVVSDSVRHRPTGRLLVLTVSQKINDVKKLEASKAMRQSRGAAISAAGRCLGPAAPRHVVTIKPGSVSGPSAGMMFALTMIDAFSDDDLTAGRTIAGTGTISPSGDVGPVGDVALKGRAAKRAGADLFLVPEKQASIVRAAVGSLRVIGVRDLDQAIETLGGTGCAV
jgi:PDZ domain-containing protein